MFRTLILLFLIALTTGCTNERKWYQSLPQAEKDRINATQAEISGLTGGDLVEFSDGRLLAVRFLRSSWDAEAPVVQVVRAGKDADQSGFIEQGVQEFTARLALTVKRIILTTDPDYAKMAAKFLQQE